MMYHLCVLIISIIGVANSLQLSGQSHESDLSKSKMNHRVSYFRGRYRNHKTHEYVQSVVAQNQKKINSFNTQNKKVLKVAKVGATNASQPSAFAMGQTKFIEFTEEEFQHYFTGLKTHKAHHKHLTKAHIQQTDQRSQDEKILSRILLQRLNPINSHASEILHNAHEQVASPLRQHDASQAHLWTDGGFYDPYSLSSTDLQGLYGKTNSDSNYGWNWKNLDPSYYDIPSKSSNYFSDWQDSHWGYDWDDQVSGAQSPSAFKSAKSTSTDSDQWWNWMEGDSKWKWDNSWSTAKSTSTPKKSNWWDTWDSKSTSSSWWSTGASLWDVGSSWLSPSSSSSSSSSSNSWWNTAADWLSPGSSSTNKNNSTVINNNNKIVTPTKPTTPTSKPIEAYASTSVDVNWAKKSATTHVKEQGVCGSCWAFSSIGVIESYYLIQGKPIMDLSQQQLVDCQKKAYGCEGGWINVAFDYVIAKGLVTQDKYPYRGKDQKCAHAEGPNKITKYQRLKGRSSLEAALRKGPIGGAVYVDNGFQFYVKGIFDKCVKDQPNHAIAIVGFTNDYWIIRNSWGADWGQEGHIRIKRSQNGGNACKIQDEAFAIL